MPTMQRATSCFILTLGIIIGLVACDKNNATNVTDTKTAIVNETKLHSSNYAASDANRTAAKSEACNNDLIVQQYQAKNPNKKIQVRGCGQVIKLLKDDNDGSRHQKFLIRIDHDPAITVLVAHNIDLAARVANIEVGTPISFYGEYIYNNKGGVVHWTHKDPSARHQNGWLDYQGQRYW